MLTFERVLQAERGLKTRVWEVSGPSLVPLGAVRWHSPWRRYVFYPRRDTLFDASCLTELSKFLSSETDQQKARRGASDTTGD